jgi:hypothetical protein
MEEFGNVHKDKEPGDPEEKLIAYQMFGVINSSFP